MSKYIQDRSNCSAYLVFKDGELIGKVQLHFGNSRVTANVWDWGKEKKNDPFQTGNASGYGYDKATAALAGCTIDNIPLTDHYGYDERTTAILKAYTHKITTAQKEGKPKKVLDAIEAYYIRQAKSIGAHFANYTEFDRKDSTSWQNGKFKRGAKGNSWRYTSLHLEAGLKKLEMLGYKVYQAI